MSETGPFRGALSGRERSLTGIMGQNEGFEGQCDGLGACSQGVLLGCWAMRALIRLGIFAQTPARRGGGTVRLTSTSLHKNFGRRILGVQLS